MHRGSGKNIRNLNAYRNTVQTSPYFSIGSIESRSKCTSSVNRMPPALISNTNNNVRKHETCSR